jgi:hypothetical protein
VGKYLTSIRGWGESGIDLQQWGKKKEFSKSKLDYEWFLNFQDYSLR